MMFHQNAHIKSLEIVSVSSRIVNVSQVFQEQHTLTLSPLIATIHFNYRDHNIRDPEKQSITCGRLVRRLPCCGYTPQFVHLARIKQEDWSHLKTLRILRTSSGCTYRFVYSLFATCILISRAWSRTELFFCSAGIRVHAKQLKTVSGAQIKLVRKYSMGTSIYSCLLPDVLFLLPII